MRYRVKQADESFANALPNGKLKQQSNMDTAYKYSSLPDAPKKELTVQALQLFMMANTETLSTIVHRSGRIGCRLCRGLHFDRKYDFIPDPARESSLQRHTWHVHPSVGDWGSLGYLWGHRTILADESKADEPTNTNQNTGSMHLQEPLLAPPYEDHDMTPPLSATQRGFSPMTVDPSALLPMPTSIPATTGSEYPSATATTYPHPSTSAWSGRAYVGITHANTGVSRFMPNPQVFSYQTKLGAFERKVKEGAYGPFLQRLMQRAFGGPAADGAGQLRTREDQMLDMIDYLLHSRKPVLKEAGDVLVLMINK